ncbi:MAG: hypothetical protein ACLQUY_20655 [Ktedonobacterales bacterium]
MSRTCGVAFAGGCCPTTFRAGNWSTNIAAGWPPVASGPSWMICGCCFACLARDYELLPTVLARLHFIAFACLLLHQVIPLISRPKHALSTLRKVRVLRGRESVVVL